MATETTLDEDLGTAFQLQLDLEHALKLTDATILRHELDLLLPEEFAPAIRVTTQTLADWRGKGEGPPYTKTAKGVFYRRADVKEWLASCRKLPGVQEAA